MAKYIPLKLYGKIYSDADYINIDPKALTYFGRCADGATIWVTKGNQRLVREILDWDFEGIAGSDEIQN
jgi:hypothetical protein